MCIRSLRPVLASATIVLLFGPGDLLAEGRTVASIAPFANFDVIVVVTAPDHIPQALVDQLAPGGGLVIPVGRRSLELLLIQKNMRGLFQRQEVLPVTFVPMTDQAQKRQKIHS
jgi:protein-L-isoaspartate O-methyltransferase